MQLASKLPNWVNNDFDLDLDLNPDIFTKFKLDLLCLHGCSLNIFVISY